MAFPTAGFRSTFYVYDSFTLVPLTWVQLILRKDYDIDTETWKHRIVAYTDTRGIAEPYILEEGVWDVSFSLKDYEKDASSLFLQPGQSRWEIPLTPLAARYEKQITIIDADGAVIPQVTARSPWFAKEGDARGIVHVDYDDTKIGDWIVTFTKVGYITRAEIMSFPSEDSSNTVALIAEAPKTDIQLAWDDKDAMEKLAISVLIGLSTIYGMKAIAGFTMQRFSPL